MTAKPSDKSGETDKSEQSDELFVPPQAPDPVPAADVPPGKPEAIDKDFTSPD